MRYLTVPASAIATAADIARQMAVELGRGPACAPTEVDPVLVQTEGEALRLAQGLVIRAALWTGADGATYLPLPIARRWTADFSLLERMLGSIVRLHNLRMVLLIPAGEA